MCNKFFILFFCIIMILFIVSCNKPISKEILKQTDWLPLIDGKISDSEYTVAVPTVKMDLFLSRDSDKLAFGLSGKTMGWIAIGFGAMGMDNSHIIMGYNDGTAVVFDEQIGNGHKHSPVEKRILIDAIITEKDGINTFEGTVLINEVLQTGKTELSLIIACGDKDNFTSPHIFRKSITIKCDE